MCPEMDELSSCKHAQIWCPGFVDATLLLVVELPPVVEVMFLVAAPPPPFCAKETKTNLHFTDVFAMPRRNSSGRWWWW